MPMSLRDALVCRDAFMSCDVGAMNNILKIDEVSIK